MTRRLDHRGLRADDGVSLLLALALVVGVGVIVGAIVSYAGVSLSTFSAQREGIQASYDVDGALQVAVDTVRLGPYNQDVDAPERCLGPTADVLTMPAAIGGGQVAVRCTPKPGTGADSGKVQITDANRFADAIFTGDGGLYQDVVASVLVRGDVSSQAGITVDGGPACAEDASYPGGGTTCGGLWSEGDIQAAGACTGTLMSVAGAKACNAASPTLPTESSPTPSVSAQHQDVPKCTAYPAGSGSTVELQPGYYDDAEALSDLTDGCGGVTKVIFRPGNYFFDFRNADAPLGKPWPLSGDDEWTIDNPDLTVIGGDPSTETDFAKGLCTSPLEQTGDHGVRFVFGGTSKLRISAGKVSLCGTYSLTSRPIAVFGATQGANPETTATGTPTGGTTGNTSGGGFSPSDPAQMAQRVTFADGATAAVAMTRQPGGPQKLFGEFSGYYAANSIPQGAILTSATLDLRHKETGALAGETVTVTFDPSGTVGPLAPATQPGTRQTLGTDTVDLMSQALVDTVHANGLNDGKVKYELTTVAGTGNIDSAIDLATLTFTWIPPGIRTQVSGTPIITTTGGMFAVDGGIYSPVGTLDLRLSDVNYLVVSAGLVAKQVTLGIEPRTGRTGPVIQTPKKSAGPADLAVYLVAYACAGPCASTGPPGAGWVAAGTAAATFKDTDTTPGGAGRKVTVDSWRLDE